MRCIGSECSKEDSLVEIATRRILANLVWIGLILGGRAVAQEMIPAPAPVVGESKVVPIGPTEAPAHTSPSESGWLLAEPQRDPQAVSSQTGSPLADSVFGNVPPPGCESCGAGCRPPDWSVTFGEDNLSKSRPRGITITSVVNNGFPVSIASESETTFGPFNLTTGSQTVSRPAFAWQNGTSGPTAMGTTTDGFGVSPSLQFTLSRYLGRDSNHRDHYLEFHYLGLTRFTSESAALGDPNPHFFITSNWPVSTNPFQAPPQPTVQSFQGNLHSPFPLTEPLFVNPYANSSSYPNNGQLVTRNRLQAATDLAVLSDAFNRADFHAVSSNSTFNQWEVNYRLDANNRADQLVLNPNGRWYRQCESGFYFSYLFGARMVILDERFEFNSRGSYYQYVDSVTNGGQIIPDTNPATFGRPIPAILSDAAGNPDPAGILVTQSGRYVVYTENDIIGLQAGGDLEYRFCKWTFNLHGKFCGGMNFAQQHTHLTAREPGVVTNPQPGQDPTITYNDEYTARVARSAALGDFGVTTAYKLRPNLTARVSYDLMWVGDLALAAEQLVFRPYPTHDVFTSGTAFYNGLTFGLEYNW